MTYWWLGVAIALLSYLLTALLRRYSLANSIIDIPTARSSHSVPTPTGGGVAVVVSFLLALPLLGWGQAVSFQALIAVGGAGALIAIIGFSDDLRHVAVRWRLLGHFAASGWALYWLGGLPELVLFGVTVNLGWAGWGVAVFYLVWMLNLYNFMDGIDGIAGVEAICACLSMCLLYALSGKPGLVLLPLFLAMAVTGFLCWNFLPARIFMGDAGSGFIGIILGIFSIQAAWASSQLLWAWLILLGVFIVDATFTLIRRLVRGDKVYEAHRSHAYQFASRSYGSHLPVTLAVVGLNLLWLLPVAMCVVMLGLDGAVGVVIAYVPLVALALKFHAGELEMADIK